ncbi:terminase large subunit [Phaeobacter gallaeciensis]|uniref:terminase large subunit n=1 Tax=Phaeobacter gallaeciensis TaxID=60890 RepID=UPI00237F50AD|nr:terminase TerL endonuclease subunit [Phaeobacter gallaeciensis]MDE4192437.1 terminase large subunit [Phaeobacter gallaeciensis]MDE4201757.1 terminase large subunit [Phaeobacter gallaeciensis]MDE4205249.1 terminase large subunit [Phaeobacter gallaeciensis]MDE4209388.1 terminase large subunit [Phaeobacter gallaeciensis]MDE4217560.1 terminase large subunit [Phaeobacter gallaeciensis]
MEPIDHPVSRYAIGVVEGDIVAGDLVRMACERHLMDLETGADRGLVFDCEAASRIIRWGGMLQHTTGPMAGRPLKLEPWQEFRHGSVFGWKHAETGLRRFRSTYHQVGKKNGKTTDTGVPMLYTQLFDGEAAPQGYCAATTKDQAGLLFKEMKRMIKRSPFLGQVMKVWRTSIETPRTDGLIACLSRDGNSSDGINPSFLARDEMHRWTDRELADTIVESMIARDQPIDWVITTAGQDRASLCGELRDYGESVLRGAVEDDSFFGFIAEPPADCDPADPRFWAMGNPNLGVSKKVEAMQDTLKKALAIAGRMPNFKRFHLNLWTEGAETWIARDVWDQGMACAPFDPAMLYGRKAWVGLDLSNKVDTTAIVVAVPVDGLIYLITYTFIPEGPKGFIQRAQTEKREYVGWRDQGWLEVHKGGTIDEDQLVNRLEWIRKAFDLQEVAYDPWGMKYLADKLDKRRFPMVEHRQGYASMSNPMKRFEEKVAQNKIRHGGNPVLGWQVGNVHRDEDAAENVKPNKKKSTGRIDAAVAAIMALGRAEVGEEKRKAREVEVV